MKNLCNGCGRMRAGVVVLLLAGLGFTVSSRAAQAQSRVSDKDVRAYMHNLNQDARALQPKFDAAVKKSSVRKTSQAKDARHTMANFVRQTRDLEKSFNKTKNGANSLKDVMASAQQIDSLVNSLQLGPDVMTQWQKVRADLHQLANAYNVPDAMALLHRPHAWTAA
jgi:hypothetical protein